MNVRKYQYLIWLIVSLFHKQKTQRKETNNNINDSIGELRSIDEPKMNQELQKLPFQPKNLSPEPRGNLDLNESPILTRKLQKYNTQIALNELGNCMQKRKLLDSPSTIVNEECESP